MVYLMRHGQDDETYVGGWSSVDLIPEGREEVQETALWIKEHLSIQKIVCSDVKRALETAKIISSILGIPYETDEHLREQNKGLLNGVPKEKAYHEYPGFTDDEISVDTVFPEGESLRNLYERIKQYLNTLLCAEDDTLFITHRGVINMIYFVLCDIPLDMDKKQFGVTTASVHALDKEKKMIKKVR